MSQESIENKQQYLRQKILDRGYDAEAFMAYCQEKQGEIVLNDWTFSKLKEIVNGFLRQCGEQSIVEEEYDNKSKSQTKSLQQEQGTVFPQFDLTAVNKTQLVFSDVDWGIFGMSPLPKQTINTNIQNYPTLQTGINYNNGNTNQQINKKILPNLQIKVEDNSSLGNKEQLKQKKSTSVLAEKKNCNKQEKQQVKVEQLITELTISKVTQIGTIEISAGNGVQLLPLQTISDIKIIKTQQKARNFLQGDYTLYHIQFSPSERIIQKKFNDFRKLRGILQKMYPQVRLPYLQPEGWIVNSAQAKNEQTLNQYKYMILEFLKYITMRNDVLKKSKIVKIFIGLSQDHEKDLKKYESMIKPKQFTDVCMPSGKFTISKDQSLVPVDKYISNVQTLIWNVDGQYQKLRRAKQTLFYNYQLVSKSLTQVAGIFESLQNLIQKFNFENDGKKDLRVYNGIKQVYLKMKSTIDEQQKILKNRIEQLFKYQKQNMTTLKQINQIRNKMYNQYVRQGLNSSKCTDFISNDNNLIKGSFSIQQPCKNKSILTLQNLFWNYSTLSNIDNYWIQLRYKINEQLTLIAYEQLSQQNCNLNFWNTVIKKCII